MDCSVSKNPKKNDRMSIADIPMACGRRIRKVQKSLIFPSSDGTGPAEDRCYKIFGDLIPMVPEVVGIYRSNRILTHIRQNSERMD